MNAVEVKKGIYWVGAIDWSLRNFHGYTTNRGATYNAYLIIDEKIALIDTVKAQFAGELLERISKVIDPEKIDYIISNHVEMDHSGSIPKVMEVCKNAAIITSSPSGLKGLTAHYGQYNYKSVKANETLSLGKRTLKFVPTPMLHWPDNMVTYCPEEKILFSNDAFGQHYASSRRFDDEEPLEIILEEAKNYYGNIIMPYGKQVQGACEIVCSLDIEMIAPSHGVIWRKNIKTIFDAYKLWSENNPQTGAIVVFDSMWHSTEVMAKTIVEAFADKNIPVKLYDLKVNHISEIIPEVLTSKYIAVGSPTLNNTIMPTVAAFLCYLKGLSPKNRKAFAFGSYGWGGQSIVQVEEELEKCGFDICLDKIRVQYIPSKQQLDEIRELVMSIE
ncbi:FprA family A-type flavoprotein [Clostridium saccharobutylicum]|uniref:Nitric oxide reductase n=1 Tax=Clostridium saccharobutylicum TaxID=169679 RepID=A0A1S8N633_CLOSA|nr:FprA family A-type flavoprotein [Clostridium saccharobutylicum]OOM11924.1 nitric oxide reductase [Clostridium saccharobutylicum]